MCAAVVLVSSACVCGKAVPYIQADPCAAESSCPFQDDFPIESILLHDTAVKINLSLALQCRSGRNFPLDQAAQ